MVGSFFNPVADTWHYETDKHIPDLSHKVIIVTGANAGLGLASVIELAKHHPRRLYLTARTKAKYDTARAAVIAAAPNANVEFLEMDLSSFASIKLAAESFLADNDRLDILMNNAGIMGQPSAATQEGYEIHFGTNHMGHALFIKLLLPLLVEIAEQPGSDVRIVNVSSEAHMFAAGNGFVPEEVKGAGKSHPFRHYGYSKMANILYTRGLATRYPAILSTSPHPGRVETELLTGMFARGGFMKWFQKTFDYLSGTLTPAQGAKNQLWCATWRREDIVNGEYYVPWGKVGNNKRGQNMETAEKLWAWTEEEFKKQGY